MTNKEFTPQAFITLSNLGGLEIMLNRSNDGVFYRFSYGQDNLENEEIFDAEITYLYSEEHEGDNEDGNAGFYHGNDPESQIFYSLNEAMKIN